MKSLSRKHAARFAQVPQLTWVMARAYAPSLPGPLGLLWAVSSVPAYLLLVWVNWGAGTLLARADGRAVFTAALVGSRGQRGMIRLAPLLVLYVALLVLLSSCIGALVDVDHARARFGLQAASIVVLAVVIMVPMQPWVITRNRAAKQALDRQMPLTEGPHWYVGSLAAWPPGRGFGMTFLREVVTSPDESGTGWLVARGDWQVAIYRRAGWQVVHGSHGRGMSLSLKARG